MTFFKKLLTSVLIFLLIGGSTYMVELIWIALADFLEYSRESIPFLIPFYAFMLIGAILHAFIFYKYLKRRGSFNIDGWLFALLLTYGFFGLLYYLFHIAFPIF